MPTSGLRVASHDTVAVRVHSPRLLALITALVWLVPLLLLAVAAWQTWRMQIAESDSKIQNVLTVVAEQTEQVFRSHIVALQWTDRRTKGWTWDEIERSAELHEFTANLDKGSDYINSIYFVDTDGWIRMSNRRFPLPDKSRYVGDRDYFIAAQNGTADAIYVGRLEQGRWSRGLSFRVARRRSSADGSFDGIIVVRLSAKYFEARCLESTKRADDAIMLYLEVAEAKSQYREDARTTVGAMLLARGRRADALKQYEALSNEAEKPAARAEAAVRAGLIALDIATADRAKIDNAMAEKARALM